MLIQSHQGMAVLLGGKSFPINSQREAEELNLLTQWSSSLGVDLPESGQDPLRAGASSLAPKKTPKYPEGEKGEMLETL